MDTITLTTDHHEVITLSYEGDTLVEVIALQGRVYTHSYLEGGKLYVADPTAPYGTISSYTRQEVEQIALLGGKIHVYVEDLVNYTILPEWWTVECEIAVQGDAPDYPLSEESVGGEENSAAWGFISFIRDYLFKEVDDDTPWDEV
jgi:hypothetical protein